MGPMRDERRMRAIAYENVITTCLKLMNTEDSVGHDVLGTQYKEIGNNVIAMAESEGFKVDAKNVRGEQRIVVLDRKKLPFLK